MRETGRTLGSMACLLSITCLLLPHVADGGDPAGCAWSPGFHLTDLDSTVNALVVHDDGTGPALYAGGHFTEIGGVPVGSIGRWDGTAWSALDGPLGNGVDGEVTALLAHDAGRGPALFAGGWFASSGGLGASNLARWGCGLVFVDRFESGDTTGWDLSVP